MSRSVRLLEAFRSGKPGLVLFYGYLIAIVVVGAILLHVGLVNGEQNDAIATQSSKQCVAIKGAIDYWKQARTAALIRQADGSRSPAEHKADALILSALDNVIAKGSRLTCEKP